MAKHRRSEVLIDKVRRHYLLTLSQLAELLGVPLSTICMAAVGNRGLRDEKLEILQTLLEHADKETGSIAVAKIVFPGYVTADLKRQLKVLEGRKTRTRLLLATAEEEFINIATMRALYKRQHAALRKSKVPERVLNSLKRHALNQDIKIDKVDQHRIVKIRATLAGIDAEIEVIKSALVKKKL